MHILNSSELRICGTIITVIVITWTSHRHSSAPYMHWITTLQQNYEIRYLFMYPSTWKY